MVKFYDFDKILTLNVDILSSKRYIILHAEGVILATSLPIHDSVSFRGGGSVMSQPQNLSLSLEQQFNLRKYEQHAKQIPREELETLFIEIIRQKMVQENLFKKMVQIP